MPDRIHRDQCPGFKMRARYLQGGQKLLSNITRQDCLGAELDHARCRQAPNSKEGPEVQILSEDDLPVAVRMLQDLAVWSIALANVAPVNGFATCGCQKFDPHRTEVHIDKEPHAEIGISISSTRQAA